jgi:glucan biosynthesis protein C
MNPAERFPALDVVRAVALLAGIVLHATLSFWPGFREANYPLSDDSSSLFLSGLFFIIHIFRMSLFFAIAGFFARVLVERLGAWGFIKNRLRRIALPLVVSMVVVAPLLFLPYLWAQKQLGMTGMPRIQPPIPDPQMPPWGHLWFLYMLMVVYALWLVARELIARADRRKMLAGVVERVLELLIASRLAPLFLAAPLAVVLYLTPWWIMWQGIPQPIMGLVPNFPSMLAFGGAFAFGWFLHRRREWLARMARDWLSYLVGAVALSTIALWIVGPMPRLHSHELAPPVRAAYAATYLAAMWCWMFALLGVATRFFEHASAHWRYLSDASFFMYIAHLPIVYALQAWMIRWPVHWSVKFPLIVSLAFAILLAMYHFLVRSTFVGKFLNGRRHPRGTGAVIPGPSTSPG